MAPRVTRGAAAKEASLLALIPQDTAPKPLLSPSAIPVPSKKKNLPKKTASPAKKVAVKEDTGGAETQDNLPPKLPAVAKKRKRVAAPKPEEEDPNELPHNLGKTFVSVNVGVKANGAEDVGPTPKKRNTKKAAGPEQETKSLAKTVDNATSTEKPAKSPRKKSAKTKDNPYGLTPGVSPYPDWPHPTPEECHEINDLLTKLHGKQGAPPKIPPPSLTITGCGEVPSILDALIRTLLSGNTTGRNSGAAMKGLVANFGTLQKGIGKGSLDYNAIRRAPLEDVIDAIKEGGMQKKKGMYIKMLLDIVYEENKARHDALLAAKDVDESAAPKGAENETKEQKDAEIALAEDHVLSLDHIHHLEKDDAITTMTKYPQIGVKTAACVVLFCMRIPCFAVDTHVFRLSKWLGWVPPDVGADPITTFRHLEVMIPDELKYSLHQLFIKHGKACPRCRAITGPNSEGWDEGCVIDHLVTRTGPMKEGLPRAKGSKGGKGKKGRKSDDSEEEESELSSLDGEDLDKEDDFDAGRKAKGKDAKAKVNARQTEAANEPRQKPKSKGKAKGTAENGKKPAEDEELPEHTEMDDEDAAMEDVANDIRNDLPKANGTARSSKGRAKVGQSIAQAAKSNAKGKSMATKVEGTEKADSDGDDLKDDASVERAAPEEANVNSNTSVGGQVPGKAKAPPKETKKAAPKAKLKAPVGKKGRK